MSAASKGLDIRLPGKKKSHLIAEMAFSLLLF